MHKVYIVYRVRFLMITPSLHLAFKGQLGSPSWDLDGDSAICQRFVIPGRRTNEKGENHRKTIGKP